MSGASGGTGAPALSPSPAPEGASAPGERPPPPPSRLRSCDSPPPQGAGENCVDENNNGGYWDAEPCQGDTVAPPEDCLPEHQPTWMPEVTNTKVDGQGKSTEFSPGDWFSYKFDLDLPSIPSDKPRKVEIDLCTNNPNNGNTAISEPGPTSFNIIHPNITEIGSRLIPYTSDVDNIPTIMDTGGLKMERMRYEFVSLASNEADGAGNRVKLDYDVVFNNVMQNIDKSEKYYITTGVTVTDGETDEVMTIRKYIFMFLDRVCLGLTRGGTGKKQ